MLGVKSKRKRSERTEVRENDTMEPTILSIL
jgi:hypothetical protein